MPISRAANPSTTEPTSLPNTQNRPTTETARNNGFLPVIRCQVVNRQGGKRQGRQGQKGSAFDLIAFEEGHQQRRAETSIGGTVAPGGGKLRVHPGTAPIHVEARELRPPFLSWWEIRRCGASLLSLPGVLISAPMDRPLLCYQQSRASRAAMIRTVLCSRPSSRVRK